jgi:two-component system CheB/CheR fusion protein
VLRRGWKLAFGATPWFWLAVGPARRLICNAVAKLGATDAQLVVIGSSAGGIEALSRVVASLPPDFPAPIVIAQHLDPRRPSHLGEILARHATLPIKVVENAAALEDGVIFVVPSNRLVEIVKGELRLRPARPGSIAPSVDLLLETAASAFGPGLIAVILTGSGSDGSAGAWQVKQAGGAVVIENPATALFPSMPRSISPSLVDATADLDSIGAVLRDLVAAGSAVPEGPEGREFAALLDRIRERSGIDFATYKTATIIRRLRGRMNATGHRSLGDYARLIETDAEEYARLISSLLIKVTEYFRDPKVFQHLRDHTLPMLIDDARQHGRQLRVWSAGCSTGEEAYSLAITLMEALGDAPGSQLEVRVFATDIDGAAIAFARRGLYPPSALKNVPADLLARYFARSDGGYEVVKSLRSLMIFGEHDLGARAPFPRIDLILCRNVLIYFNQAMQRAALETFGFSLRDDGRLVLGPSETVAAMPELYAEDHGRLRIYRRLPGLPPPPLARRNPVRPNRELSLSLDSAIRSTRQDVQAAADSTEEAEALLLEVGLGIVVVDARYYITRINTTARGMLGIHGLAFDQDFIHLAESLPSTAIRAAIDAAFNGKTTTTVHEVEATDVSADGPRFIETVVRPHVHSAGASPGAAIELSDITIAERNRLASTGADRRLERASVVNQRLRRANDELTELIAQLRLANQAMLQSSEEAQSGREEVETLNEEFQATNEELETLNEELTASVEELRVANEDLAARTDELRLQTVALEEQKQEGEEQQNRLQSILASLGDAVVAVDHAGRTVATNPAYDRIFGGPDAKIRPEDVAGLPLPAAERPQQRAARGEQFRMEFAVSDQDGTRRWFEAVTEPLTREDRTWGGVVAIRDVSERTMRQSLERLMAAAGHELKTPTAAIHNYLQLVERHLAAGEAEKAGTYADRALNQTRRLATLIERLLDVSRIQSGQLELMLETVDLATLVRSAVDVAQVLPKAPPIRLTVAPKPVRVRVDPGRLEQVFLNLLANAMDHAPGSATIDLTVGVSDGRAEVTVRDHGPGVKAKDIRTMFEAYTRLGHPHRGPGLGLGLYVAREIVTAHDGEIDAASRIGKGTVVTVRLPLASRRSRGRRTTTPERGTSSS